jgi:hypothetical protein
MNSSIKQEVLSQYASSGLPSLLDQLGLRVEQHFEKPDPEKNSSKRSIKQTRPKSYQSYSRPVPDQTFSVKNKLNTRMNYLGL